VTPVAIRRELSILDDDRARLEGQRDGVQAALTIALAADAAQFSSQLVRERRHDLASLDSRLRDVADRHAALSATLPSPEQVRQAESNLARLAAEAAAASVFFDAAVADYTAAVDKAERAARMLVLHRITSITLVAEQIDLAVGAGLTVDVQPARELPPAIAAVARLAGLFIAQSADGQPDDTVVRDLNAARAA
jgi:hypothetical protein